MQTLPKEAVRRKWVKIKVVCVPNRNGDQRDEGTTVFRFTFVSAATKEAKRTFEADLRSAGTL